MPIKLLQAGWDFPSNFEKDNFASRRTTGNNMFDPDSFITGEELAAGMTYKNSSRVYRDELEYSDAVHGLWNLHQIAVLFPRQPVKRVEFENPVLYKFTLGLAPSPSARLRTNFYEPEGSRSWRTPREVLRETEEE